MWVYPNHRFQLGQAWASPTLTYMYTPLSIYVSISQSQVPIGTSLSKPHPHIHVHTSKYLCEYIPITGSNWGKSEQAPPHMSKVYKCFLILLAWMPLRWMVTVFSCVYSVKFTILASLGMPLWYKVYSVIQTVSIYKDIIYTPTRMYHVLMYMYIHNHRF